jgi:hypothetical protein
MLSGDNGVTCCGVGETDLLSKTVANGGEGGAVLDLLLDSSNKSKSARYLFLLSVEGVSTTGWRSFEDSKVICGNTMFISGG